MTGKFEAHLWDGSVLRPRTNRRGRRKGKQIYLGAFSDELQAARTYDMAAIHFWGEDTILNVNFNFNLKLNKKWCSLLWRTIGNI